MGNSWHIGETGLRRVFILLVVKLSNSCTASHAPFQGDIGGHFAILESSFGFFLAFYKVWRTYRQRLSRILRYCFSSSKCANGVSLKCKVIIMNRPQRPARLVMPSRSPAAGPPYGDVPVRPVYERLSGSLFCGARAAAE